MAERRCAKCKTFKPLSEWDTNKASPTGLQSWCRQCRQKMSTEYYKKNIDWINERTARYRFKLKLELLRRLGLKCVKCGDKNIFHLQIAHKYNDGAKERKEYNSDGISYSMIRDYLLGIKDISRLETQCSNCNHEIELNRGRWYPKLVQEMMENP